MACEFMAVKLLEPVFGASILLWGCVLGFSLLSLSAGYILQEKILAGKYSIEKSLIGSWVIVGLSVTSFALMVPVLQALERSLSFNLALLLSSLIIVAPCLLFSGVSSPLLIETLSRRMEKAKASGLTLSVSTFGGVIFSVLTSYYFVPVLGIKISSMTIGSSLIIICIVTFLLHLKENHE